MSKGKTIDINCDLGESYGNFKIGNDQAIFPYLTSCNIACGFHGGDPFHLEETIKRAIKYNVQIGAHPSYPDLGGFGRRKMMIPGKELKSIVKYQIAALKGLAESLGATVEYVKPHGALYNSAMEDHEELKYIISAVQEISPKMALMGLAGSSAVEVAQKEGIQFIAEAFADRVYTTDGKLMSRRLSGAVIQNGEKAAGQVLNIVKNQKVKTNDGAILSLIADSICIHGDNPKAIEIAKAIDKKLMDNHIDKQRFTSF